MHYIDYKVTRFYDEEKDKICIVVGCEYPDVDGAMALCAFLDPSEDYDFRGIAEDLIEDSMQYLECDELTVEIGEITYSIGDEVTEEEYFNGEPRGEPTGDE